MAFVIKPGAALEISNPPNWIPHPHICITHLGGGLPLKIVIVNLTSAHPGCDTTTVFGHHDHPWIRKPTYVYYQRARVIEAQKFLEQANVWPQRIFRPLLLGFSAIFSNLLTRHLKCSSFVLKIQAS